MSVNQVGLCVGNERKSWKNYIRLHGVALLSEKSSDCQTHSLSIFHFLVRSLIGRVSAFVSEGEGQKDFEK